MKNISTFILVSFFTIFSVNAQFNCAGAVTITPGTQTVSEVISGTAPNPECAENYGAQRTGGRWYVFTATVDGIATVSSDIASNNNTDTRLHVYSGTCSTLTCLGGNDDIDLAGQNKTSEVTFPITNGASYYIGWDNQWSTNGFDFTLSETAVTCPSGLPLTEDFEDENIFYGCYLLEDADGNDASFRQQFIDLDGSGTENVYVTNGSTSNTAKNDWIFTPSIDLSTGVEYNINFTYNGADGSFPADENLEVLLVDSPSSVATVLTSLYYESGIVLTGNFSQAESMATTQSITYTSSATGTYYLAFNATSVANTGSLLLFDYSIDGQTLSLNENDLNTIINTYNKHTNVLSLKSSALPFNNIEIFNLLGQRVLSNKLSSINENINLSFLKDGIYLGKATIGNKTSSFKVLKQ